MNVLRAMEFVISPESKFSGIYLLSQPVQERLTYAKQLVGCKSFILIFNMNENQFFNQGFHHATVWVPSHLLKI